MPKKFRGKEVTVLGRFSVPIPILDYNYEGFRNQICAKWAIYILMIHSSKVEVSSIHCTSNQQVSEFITIH